MTPDDFRQVQLLAFEGELFRWALPSAAVLSVIEERDWRGADPTDAAKLARIAVSPTLTPVRVLVLGLGQGQLPVRVRGPLSLVNVPASDLLPLPPEFGLARFVATQIALLGGKPSLVVLDVTRLADAVTHHFVSSAPVAQGGGSR